MKIFSATQIKEWDQYTIEHTPITSLELMERAATACFTWIKKNIPNKSFIIFCGKGNNGGDGLAIARLLFNEQFNVSVYVPHIEKKGSDDFESNLTRLYGFTKAVYFVNKESELPEINKDDVVIDALFGTGLHNAIIGLNKSVVDHINNSSALKLSIDMPSGLFTDRASNECIIKAGYTLTFERYKLALLMAENEKYFGNVIVLPIGLHPQFEAATHSNYSLVSDDKIFEIYKPRIDFAHKGTFGHAGIIAGSYGMMGAAVLCTKACVTAGAGKVTATVCKKGYTIMQLSVPEAMCQVSGNNVIKDIKGVEKFSSIGIGPGIGTSEHNIKIMTRLFKQFKRTIVIDADALNTMALNSDLKKVLPKGSILTPHPKEFDNLFGECTNDFERLKSAMRFSVYSGTYIILKGHRTVIATPEGKAYFNTTGNAGMAKGGSGDVLTGILTSLLAQGYSCEEACLLGVYIHGRAGDIAAEKFSKEAMTPSDIISSIGEVFKEINNEFNACRSM